MTCNVDSKPIPTLVYWEKKNGFVTRITNNTFGIEGLSKENPSMTILYATVSDAGLYTCFVGNGVGISQSSNINVTAIGGKSI